MDVKDTYPSRHLNIRYQRMFAGAFMYAVYGAILDNFEGLSGYRIVFIVMAVFAVIGFLLSSYILRVIRMQKVE